MKVLLINPPTGLFIREDRCQSAVGDFAVSFLRPPHDLMLIASNIKDVADTITIRDYPVEKKSWSDFEKDLYKFSPDLLVLSITTPTICEDLRSCRIAKFVFPKIITVAKGAHFNLDDVNIMRDHEELDIVIRNESFLTVRDIMVTKKLDDVTGITFRNNGKITRNPDRKFLDDIDRLPIPDRELIDNSLYVRPDTGEPMALIEVSRGCPYNCIFCLVGQVSGKNLRKRSPDLIINEIEKCIKDFNIYNFHFKSDTFTCDRQWVIALCKEIIKRNLGIKWLCNSRVDTADKDMLLTMREAGCFAIGFGIESANQMILDNIKKGTTAKQAKEAISLCRDMGIMSYAYFMIGFPWDTKRTIYDSIQFAIDTDPDFVDFFIAYPFPGTLLEKLAIDENLLMNNNAQGVKAYAGPALRTHELSEKELNKIRKFALRKFYLRPSYIAKALLRVKSFRILINYMREANRIFFKVLYGSK